MALIHVGSCIIQHLTFVQFWKVHAILCMQLRIALEKELLGVINLQWSFDMMYSSIFLVEKEKVLQEKEEWSIQKTIFVMNIFLQIGINATT